MKNLKVGKKFIVSFGSILTLFLMSVIVGTIGIVRARSSYADFYTNDFQEAESVTIAGYLLENYKVELGTVITLGDFDIKVTDFSRNYIEWMEVSPHQDTEVKTES